MLQQVAKFHLKAKVRGATRSSGGSRASNVSSSWLSLLFLPRPRLVLILLYHCFLTDFLEFCLFAGVL